MSQKDQELMESAAIRTLWRALSQRIWLANSPTLFALFPLRQRTLQ